MRRWQRVRWRLLLVRVSLRGERQPVSRWGERVYRRSLRRAWTVSASAGPRLGGRRVRSVRPVRNGSLRRDGSLRERAEAGRLALRRRRPVYERGVPPRAVRGWTAHV